MINYDNQRVGVFVEVQNLYYSARAMYESYVNFGKIVEKAIDKRQPIRIMAYVIRSDAPKEQGFFDALANFGIELNS